MPPEPRVLLAGDTGNERLEYTGVGFVSIADPGVVMPCYGPID